MRFQLLSIAVIATVSILSVDRQTHASAPRVAPELTHRSADDWINSTPLSLAQLRGKPVLVEFWTFDCINCLNSLEWMKATAKSRTSSGLAIVAVHTPELSQERVPENVRAAVRKLGIEYPVMLDRDFSFWNAMDNHYWPAFYLIDKNGRVRTEIVGELHLHDRRAEQFEREIDRALAE